MYKNSLLNKLSSKYLIYIIHSYIKDENSLYKLITYSKYFQKKLNISSIDYQNIFYKSILEFNKNIFFDLNDKTKENFEKILLNYNIDRDFFEEKAVNYFKTKQNYEITNLISFDCPIFEPLSNIENFDKIFAVAINLNNYFENNKNYYDSCLDKLNHSKKLSSLVIYFKEINDLICFKYLNINFEQIKKLEIIKATNNYQYRIPRDYYYFFKNIFPFKDFQNNLQQLNLDLISYNGYIESNCFEKINELKSLITLELTYFKFFDSFLEIKLNNLKSLSIEECENISFEDNNFTKLNQLNIINCLNITSKSKLKCPELEHCSIYNRSNSLDFDSILDFSSLNKLKSYKGNSTFFLLLESEYLEKITLINDNTDLMERNIMKKMISTKTLKEISFIWYKLTNEEISQIDGENTSVVKMIVKTTFKDFVILQKKFPNLISIDIDYINDRNVNIGDESSLEIGIIPDHNSKIKDIAIVNGNKCYCQPYEKLESIEIKVKGVSNQLVNFPIFNDKCATIFNNLISFRFWGRNETESPKYLCTLAKNINNMPNLKDIKLLTYYDYKTFREKDFKEFIKNILYMKYIKTINISLRRDSYYYEYPLNVLKEYFPDLNFNKFKKIFIMKSKAPEDVSFSKHNKKIKDKCNIF